MSDESGRAPGPPLNVFDYERLARERMPGPVWDFVSAGADDELTLAENRRAFERVTIRPRMLVDVSRIDMTTTLLGDAVAAPIMIAPCGPQGAMCEAAEAATARAAGGLGLAMAAATGSTLAIEDIAAASSPASRPCPRWSPRPAASARSTSMAACVAGPTC